MQHHHSKPTCLHIVHSWGGGIERWLQDFTRADSGRHHLILRARGIGWTNGFKHELCHAGDVKPIQSWSLKQPIASTAIVHPEYQHMLHDIIMKYSVTHMMVSSFIGHSLDTLRTGRPTQIILHDFYPFCTAFKAHFEGDDCASCEPDRLRRCLKNNPMQRHLPRHRMQGWLQLREAFLKALTSPWIGVIAPSVFAARRARELMRIEAQVVPHGIDITSHQPIAPAADPRLQCDVLGRLDHSKGLGLLTESLSKLSQVCDIHLLGCGKTARHLKPFVQGFVARYDHGDLGRHLSRIKPHLGLLLSVVPETFGYTLSELWHYGIPPVATALGSFADRIQDGVNGFLIEPGQQSLGHCIRDLNQQRDKIEAVRQEIGGQEQDNLESMVAAYHNLPTLPDHSNSIGIEQAHMANRHFLASFILRLLLFPEMIDKHVGHLPMGRLISLPHSFSLSAHNEPMSLRDEAKKGPPT